MHPISATRGNRGKGSHQRGEVNARAKRKDQDNLTLATYFGMMILLIAVIITVVVRVPNFPSDPTFITTWNDRQEVSNQFFEAKSLVKPFIKEFLEKKSHQVPGLETYQASWKLEHWTSLSLDGSPSCHEIGNGVWYASGTIVIRSSEGLAEQQSWEIYFVAKDVNPLYSKVGGEESGSLAQALSRTHMKPSNDSSRH